MSQSVGLTSAQCAAQNGSGATLWVAHRGKRAISFDDSVVALQGCCVVFTSDELRSLAALEREIARQISNQAPAHRHDPEPSQSSRISLRRAEALESLADARDNETS